MKNGQFCKVDGEYYFKEFKDKFGEEYTLYPLEKVEGFCRTVDLKVCFSRDITDSESFKGKKKVWFVQKETLTVRPEIANIWLVYNSKNKKYYLRDFEELGMVLECPLETSNNVFCDKSEPMKTDIQCVREFMKTSGYIYNGVSLNSKGEIEDYITTV